MSSSPLSLSLSRSWCSLVATLSTIQSSTFRKSRSSRYLLFWMYAEQNPAWNVLNNVLALQ